MTPEKIKQLVRELENLFPEQEIEHDEDGFSITFVGDDQYNLSPLFPNWQITYMMSDYEADNLSGGSYLKYDSEITVTTTIWVKPSIKELKPQPHQSDVNPSK